MRPIPSPRRLSGFAPASRTDIACRIPRQFLVAPTAMQHRSDRARSQITGDAGSTRSLVRWPNILPSSIGLAECRHGFRHRRHLDEPWFTTSSTDPRCGSISPSPAPPNFARATSSPKSVRCAARDSHLPATSRSFTRNDHRHRRTGGLGQGHARQTARGAFRPAPSRYRADLSRGRQGAARRGTPLDDKTQAVAAARALDPARSTRRSLKGHAIGEAASIVSAIPEVRDGALRVSARFRRSIARRGARRARHRNGHLPGCGREDLRRCGAGGAGAAPRRRAQGGRPAGR